MSKEGKRLKPDLIFTLPARPVPYAVLGSPVSHSLSPAMQQAAFAQAGVEALYYRIEVDESNLETCVARLRQVPFGGWNCTVPNKLRMLELCDRLAESATQFRAVNTVVNDDGTLVGHNTDGTGWSRALREAFGHGPGDLRLLLLGAGGAGRALATQAILEKCPLIIIANRNPLRAQALVKELLAQFSSGTTARTPHNLRAVPWNDEALAAALREVDLVANATSAGLDPKAPPVLASRLIPAEVKVFDTVYGPACESLRREVAAAGAGWSDGLGMLLHQGAEAFALWTRQPAPLEVMRLALASAVRSA